MSIRPEDALEYHSSSPAGKVSVTPTKPCRTQRDLSLAYTPGVAVPCLEIERDPSLAYKYTAKGNLVAVISNGTAVLGLGNIGALAGKPVMEGKAVLFKRFADIDVFDIELDTWIPNEVIRACQILEPTFGGINLEDIKAPECFDIEEELKRTMKIPVFHDDQHGTAIISGAACSTRSKSPARTRGHQGRVQRRRRERDLLRRALRAAGRAARKHRDVRHQGRDLQRPHRGHEPVQGALRVEHRGAHADRGAGGRRRVLRALQRRLRDRRDGAGHGAEPDHLRAGQSRSGNRLRRRAGGAPRRHHGHRPLATFQPGEQRPRVPVHLPRRARRARHHHQRRDETGGHARAGRAGQGGRAGFACCAPTGSTGSSSAASTSSPSRSIRGC